MLGFAAIATPLFNIILGDEWLEAVPIFRILCLSAIFYPVHAFNVNIFKVVGRSDIFLKTVIIKKLLVLVSVLCVVSFGIYALLWSMLINNIIALFINTYYNKDLIEYPAKSQLYDLISTTITTIFMALAVFYITSVLTDINNFLTIFISIFSGIIIYIALSYLFNKEILQTTFKLVRR
jgi:O-antigen/teichoic acid export membrane protein